MPLFPALRAPFRAVATTVVPEARALAEPEWAELERIVEQAVSERPPKMQRQLAAFLRVLDVLPLARFGRRFTALDDVRRTRVLRGFERSGALLLRRGFWGLRTLVYMGYYARPSAAAAVGYRANVRGWEARA